MLHSGKIIRKSDVYKRLEAWPERKIPEANRQLVRHAACKTVQETRAQDRKLRKQFEKFMDDYESKKDGPTTMQGLDPNENTKRGKTNQGQTENPQESEKKAANETRTSNRARKAVVKDGGVTINAITKRKREKQDEIEHKKTIFDPILVESDSSKGELERFQKLSGKDTTDVEAKSETNSLIRTVQESKKAEEQAEQPEGADRTPKKQEETKRKIFTRQDLAQAALRMQMRGFKHPICLSAEQTKGSATRLGRYEFPESKCLRPIGWGAGRDFPAHIAEYYPKPQVPRRFIAIPDYTAIMDKCQRLRQY